MLSTSKRNNIPKTPYSIIQKKRNGKKLTPEEIRWFLDGFVSKQITDAQMSALLMAICINGMDGEETATFTDIMLYSGKVLDFKEQAVIDKHSTGGVGDKTSFILAPIAAACGVKVPMIAGRGLGHSGGTVDKIEAIPGFNTSLSLDEFSEYLPKYGLVLIGQTGELAPIDKRIYALRDVTATVESYELITASIMSKKLAEGTSGIVMDVKAGNGAFMKNKTQARKLAKSMEDTALRFNKNIMTLITDMSQPLGNTVGNSLEIIESIETLQGRGPKDLTDLSVQLAGGMVYLAGLAKSHKEGIKKALATIKNGSAFEEFKKLIKRQGGDISYLSDFSKFKIAPISTQVPASKSGYITSMDTYKIGMHCVNLGGGRRHPKDLIDFSVGLTFHKKVGQKVKKGEALLTIHHHKKQLDLVQTINQDFINNIIKISSTKPKTITPLVFEVRTKWSKQ
ncbi:MAG: thymidine phosphorylase [Bacteriovoracaceae bacterium]|nr:thymidine phosphorylase [Bacteriovoracaceae bacterium]